jgi:uncharacterized lipoprotein YmbA
VADYLRNEEIAVRTTDNEVDFSLFHCWAEPLQAGIRRVLAEDLRAAPGIQAVLTDEPSPTKGPVYNISIRVLACEGVGTNHQGSAVFAATWEIDRTGPEPATLACGVFHSQPASWNPGDYGQLSRQLSRALDDFSRALSKAIFGASVLLRTERPAKIGRFPTDRPDAD